MSNDVWGRGDLKLIIIVIYTWLNLEKCLDLCVHAVIQEVESELLEKSSFLAEA